MANAIRKTTDPAHGFAEHAEAFTSYKALEDGIPAAWARSLESQGLTRADIRRIIPDRTLDRRIAKVSTASSNGPRPGRWRPSGVAPISRRRNRVVQ